MSLNIMKQKFMKTIDRIGFMMKYKTSKQYRIS